MSASSKNSATQSTSTTPTKSLMEMNETEYEEVLTAAHKKAKKLARKEDNTDEVLIAKLAALAIRQLHASGVYPRTALRAMVHMEFDEENRSTGGAIARAKKDIREEDRAGRTERDAVERGGKTTAAAAKGEMKGKARLC